MKRSAEAPGEVRRRIKRGARAALVAANTWAYRRLAAGGRADIRVAAPPKLSFCTTCMGRLHHLRETLPQNLRDAASYADAEFVVLNYNSPDGMEEWMRDQMADEIRRGRVRYFRTDEPVHFINAHAKNLAKKLADGDVVCNVDADNFIGSGFVEYLAGLFARNPRSVLSGDWRSLPDTVGRTALLRTEFLAAGGYSEAMRGWGGEETDLVQRLVYKGFKHVLVTDPAFLRFIPHSNEERVRHYDGDLKDPVATERRNMRRAWRSVWLWNYRANRGVAWGKGVVYRNFESTAIEMRGGVV